MTTAPLRERRHAMEQIGSTSELAEQLVVEITVSDLDRSLELYTALGFTLERRDGDFAALRWGERRLFLDQRSDLPALSGPARANVRILVPDVDRLWAVTQALGLAVERPIADRYYGLRDFTVLDPDGFGLRFASRLPTSTAPPAG
ncbi:MAG TPA: VOC family protein [Gemmatimonadaceae bacterium]|nr:VOC family protein [Gemmatimonadaceae bacterium]